ncbi:MAG: regulatory protein RecX [bacterium]
MRDPLTYCLVLIKKRLRSRYELDQAMKRHEVEDEKRDEVLQVLTEQGLVNDTAYARAWVHTRDRLAPRGAAVLRQELMLKGIGKEIISEVLAERREQSEDEEDEQPTEDELARRLMAGKERLYANLTPEVRKRRLMAFLQRRGFSYDVIRRILDA